MSSVPREASGSGPAGPRAAITRRYVLALTLIAAVLTLQLATVTQQLRAAEGDAEVINRSGMQRMLSQRIAALSQHMAAEGGEVERGHLEEALSTFRANQFFLVEAPEAPAGQTPSLRRIYEGEHGLSARVNAYAETAGQVVALHREGGPDAVRRSGAHARLGAVSEDLLARLNRATSEHNRVAADRVSSFHVLEVVFFAAGLLLLMLEARFLFVPLVRQLGASFRALHDKNDELRAFSSRISHDLRAPVASGRGMSEVVLEALEEGDLEEARFAAHRTAKALERLDLLIADLSTLTKVRLKEGAEAPSPVDMGRTVQEAVDKVRDLVDTAGIRVTHQNTLSGRVLTRSTVLQHIVDNLVSNAAKYRDPEASEPEMFVSVLREGPECVVRIEDNGLGIPEPKRAELFDPFRRFHSNVSFGSGLGLYLARRSAEALGGELIYRPLPVGSSFELRFPFVAASAR